MVAQVYSKDGKFFFKICCGRKKLHEREGKRKDFAWNPIFGGSCIPKPLPLKESPITMVLQVAQRIKRTQTGGQ